MLFKSLPETYNPQIHTEEMSLALQMNKAPEVHKGVLSRFEKYTKLSSWLMHTGRIDGGVQAGLIKRPAGELHDNAYRVQYKGLNILPAYAMGGIVLGKWHETDDMTLVTSATYANGVTAATVKTDVSFSLSVKHEPQNGIFGDKFNPSDSIKLNGGLGIMLLIQRVRRASTNDHYILDGKVVGKAKDWDPTHVAEDTVLTEGGNYQGEGSMTGYQRERQVYWEIFYSFISRYTLTFTGNSLDQRRVVWTDTDRSGAMKGPNGTGFWQFEKEWEADEIFAIFLELALRFSVSSMDPSSHEWFQKSGSNLLSSGGFNPQQGIFPPRTPDGWIEQIKDTIDISYDPNTGLDPFMVQAIMAVLAANSPAGSQGNEFVIIGDMIGFVNWDRAMKKAMVGANINQQGAVGTTNVVYDIGSQKEISLGFNVTKYHYLGNEITFLQDELFNHPGLFARSGGLPGTGNLFILNVTPVNGVSNFELFARGQGRFFKKKYVDGIHSLDPGRDSGNTASSGFDGAFVHYLAELFPVMYYKNTCAVIRANAKYNGGLLSGAAGLQNFPSVTY